MKYSLGTVALAALGGAGLGSDAAASAASTGGRTASEGKPASPETERLMNQVMAAWTAFEPRETARWAAGLQNPAAAAQWAAGITDRGKRDHSMTRIVREWKNHDLGAALAFVRTTPAIDDNLRRRLLR